MPTVALRFSPLAEHVRTARLVAVSVARRAGCEEEQLDEIRVAIGEACARAIGQGGADGARVGLVDMTLRDDDGRLDVLVVQCSSTGEPLADVPDATPVAAVPDRVAPDDPLSMALLEGLSERSDAGSTSARLSWSLPAGPPRATPVP